ncbi:hypothetical protein MXB_1964 [Myxobolus squamalis]|nr:hypothetical protein MXB_1964 [Myxobolus squamalis]
MTLRRLISTFCASTKKFKRLSKSGCSYKRDLHFSAPFLSKDMTVRDALNSAIDEEIERDPRVFVIGEEVAQFNGAYKVTRGLYDKYGSTKLIDTPITEVTCIYI